MSDTFYEDRRRLWSSLVATGATLQEIGETYGVTWQRVQQVVGQGHRPCPGADPVALLRAIRSDRTLMTWSRLPWRAQDTLYELGLLNAVERLFQWRQRRAQRELRAAHLQQIHQFVADHGRTPYSDEMREMGFWFGSHSRMWRSSNELLRAAGYPPRPVGLAGYRGRTP